MVICLWAYYWPVRKLVLLLMDQPIWNGHLSIFCDAPINITYIYLSVLKVTLPMMLMKKMVMVIIKMTQLGRETSITWIRALIVGNIWWSCVALLVYSLVVSSCGRSATLNKYQDHQWVIVVQIVPCCNYCTILIISPLVFDFNLPVMQLNRIIDLLHFFVRIRK